MYRRVYFFLLLLTVIIVGALKESADAQETLTLDQAVALAIRNNRLVINASLEAEKGSERMKAAFSDFFPEFNLYILGSKPLTNMEMEFKRGSFGDFSSTGPIPAENTTVSSDRDPTTLIAVRVSQPLTQLYRINLGFKLREASLQIDREKLRKQRQDVTNSVKHLYYGLLESQSRLEAAQESAAFYRELDRTVENYVDQQKALKSESFEVKAKLARAEYDILSLRNVAAGQKEQLNQLLGRDTGTPFRVVLSSEPGISEEDIAAARGRALDQRPDINEAKLRVRQAEYDKRIKKAEYVPDLSLTFDYISFQNAELLPRDYMVVGLLLNWNVWDWGRRGHELAEKNRALYQARHSLTELEAAATVDVNARYRKRRETRELITVADLSRKAARETVRTLLDRYAHESALLKDVLEAQAALADANREHDQAVLDFRTAIADLDKAMGAD